jgi:hypothetical protein
MSAINFPEYVNQITGILSALTHSGHLVIVDFQHDQRSELRGFIGARLQFADRTEPHMREFIDLTLTEPRLMYVYHYQDHVYQDHVGQMIFRYDDAAHRPPVGQAEHKHRASGVVPAPVPTLLQVLDEILRNAN